MKYFKLFFLFIGMAYCSSMQAQHRTTTPKPQPVVKYRPPALTTSLGIYKDTSDIPAKQLAGVIGLPLKITDAKNNIYTISSYQFSYRQLAVSEDDSLTGRPKLTTYQRVSFFRTTPLTGAWLNIAQENPHAGEEYIFFDIIVKDAQGRVMYAPNLKLTLK